MVAVQRERGFASDISNAGHYLPDGRWRPVQPWENRPELPFDWTIKLLNAIPKGKWIAPKGFGKYYFSREFDTQEAVYRTISPWVHFLNRAQKGFEVVEENLQTNTFTLGGNAINRLEWFFEATKRLGIKDEANQKDFLNSSRRGLANLLGAEERKKLGVIDQQPVSEADIASARKLVGVLSEGYSYERLKA